MILDCSRDGCYATTLTRPGSCPAHASSAPDEEATENYYVMARDQCDMLELHVAVQLPTCKTKPSRTSLLVPPDVKSSPSRIVGPSTKLALGESPVDSALHLSRTAPT